MRNTAYLSLGSNVGDPRAHLKRAAIELRSLGEVTGESSIYKTEPVENTQQPWFLNCVIELETEKTPRQLLEGILAIEQELGRRRQDEAPGEKGPRIIDIDIVLYGDLQVEEEDLTIPHPRMHLRRFVLAPLAEIAPQARHPRLQRTALESLNALPEDGPAVVLAELII